MEFLAALVVFFLVMLVGGLAYFLLQRDDSRTVSNAVKKYTSSIIKEDDVDILYYRKFSAITPLNSILSIAPGIRRLDELLQQAGLKILAGVFVLVSLITGAAVNLLVSWLTASSQLVNLSVGCVAVLFPMLVVLVLRSRRRARFEELFPDALDLMAYSLKAGHSIMASLRMVAEEIADPVAEEFERAVEEINFGRSVDVTLRNMARRIDTAEVRYFATSVIIQRETGGNLVAILQKISEVIRKKFRFRERVRALSAEGKISALILVLLPIFVGLAVILLNPKYIMVLVIDPIGHYMLGAAAVMMCLGSFMIYRLVQLDM